ncbi:hypothetical protein [Pseudoroseicyclus tamaricis]|uniref:hypothetical protein n=1 Tax=Pseudoroseicyclus tamaricis TaxID=2705421 RepID=UPI001F4007DB|nr:hypothetical protein [Pseudoroseicyclus tamaricis]
MAIVAVDRVAWLPGGAAQPELAGVTDLWVETGPEGPILYTVSEQGRAVSTWLAKDGAFTAVDKASLPASYTPGVDASVTVVEVAGMELVCITGLQDEGARLYRTDAAGEIYSFPGANPFAALPDDVSHATLLEVGGRLYVYGLRPGCDAISTWEVTPSGALSAVSLPAPERNAATGPGLADVAALHMHGADWLVGASSNLDAMVLFRIGADGVPEETGRVWNLTGVGLESPSTIVTAEIGGHGYAVMGSCVTSTLTVAEIMPDGALRVTDHVLDSRDTRFQWVSTLEAIEIGGRVYIVAAGGDDGITLMELLPGGRLLTLAVLEDQLDTGLFCISDVALSEAADGGIDIFVSSGLEPGLTWLHADLPSAGRSEAAAAPATTSSSTGPGPTRSTAAAAWMCSSSRRTTASTPSAASSAGAT